MENIRINEQKVKIVAELQKYIEAQKGIAFFLGNKISSNEMNSVRKQARKQNIKIEVAKNSLWKIALGNNLKVLPESLPLKQNTIAFIADSALDAIGFVQSLKKDERLLFSSIMIIDKGGFITEAPRLANLAKLKSKQGAVSSLIMSFKYPMLKLVKALSLIKK
jgi:ribosomal protein L10